MKLRFSARSDVGKKRKDNEDSYLVDKNLRLFVVCDGMGGHNAGEVASSMAARIVRDAVNKGRDQIPLLADGTVSQRHALRTHLRNAVRVASHRIYKKSQEEADYRGMGTTLTLMLMAGARAFIAHVGDSRLYLYREGRAHLITTDHSMVNQLIRAGDLSPEEVSKVPFGNALTRAVGVYPDVEVDTHEVDLLPGDVFLICSDGLHGYFEGTTQVEQGLALDFEQRAPWFIEFANEAGGKDNITAIVVEVEEVADREKSARVRLTLDTLRGFPLFRHLAYPELQRVISVSRAREVKPSEVIIRQGDEGDALYIVLEGRVSVEQNGSQVAVLGPGRHFGEMSLVDDQPRSATVVAIEPTLLIRIVRGDFYDLLRQDSVMAVKLLWNFVQALSATLRSCAPEAVTEGTEVTLEVSDDPYSRAEEDRSFTRDAFAKTDPRIPALGPHDLDELEDTEDAEDG